MNNLPVLKCEVVALVKESNLPLVVEAITKYVEGINTDLNVDADFVQAKDDVKTLQDLEAGIRDAKKTMLAEAEELNRHLTALDNLAEVPREKRLDLSKVVKKREDEISDLLINGFVAQAVAFTSEQMKGRGFVFDLPLFDPWAAVKGAKKTSENYVKKLTAALDEYKDSINILLRDLDAKTLIFEQQAEGYSHLFPDAAKLIQQTDAGMIRDLVNARITTAKQAEAARIAEDARLAEEVEAPKAVELPKRFETVEKVDEETGEVETVRQEVEMVSLPKVRLLEVLRDVSCMLLDSGNDDTTTYGDLERLIAHIKGL